MKLLHCGKSVVLILDPDQKKEIGAKEGIKSDVVLNGDDIF